MTVRPFEIDAELVASLREEGLDQQALRMTAAIGFHFNFMNRIADAFDFEVLDAAQRSRVARLLDLQGRHVPVPPEGEPWTRGDDGRLRPPELERTRQDLLTGSGVTKRGLRREVDAYVRQAWSAPGAGEVSVPEPLERYLDKLARYAYRILDEEVEALRQGGFADEGIFEITITGAVTAASLGVEQLFLTLYGRPPSES